MVLLSVGLGVAHTSDGTNEPDDQVGDRWYTESQLKIGKRVFDSNCASCHGLKGQGLTEDWKKPIEGGSHSPPPLDGTAHTWHHPVSILLRTINNGGKPLGGKMPSFRIKLKNNEKTAVIAYFQSWWPDDIYEAWIQRGGLSQ